MINLVKSNNLICVNTIPFRAALMLVLVHIFVSLYDIILIMHTIVVVTMEVIVVVLAIFVRIEIRT